MSKISTRKGLALGTVVALGFSALTGIAPAQAADLVTLVPAAGTSYNVPADESFKLDTYFASAAQSAASDVLKVKITDSSEGIDLSAATAAIDFTATTGNGADVANFAALDATSKSVVTTTTGTLAGIANKATITLTPKGSRTAKFSVDVVTWVDRDGNSTYDSANGEVSSATRTINFLTKSDITAAVTIGETVDLASTDASAKVVFTPALNLDLFADATTKVLTLAGLDVKLDGVVADSLTLNSDGSVTAEENTAVTAEDYVVEAFLGSDSLGKATKTVKDNNVDDTKSTFVATKTANVLANGEVRVGTTSTEAVFTIKNTDDKSVGAGVLVRVTLDEATSNLATPSGTGAVEDTVKVNGKSVSESADVTFNVLTDSNGQVKLPVVATGATAGTKVNFDLVFEDDSKADALTIEWKAAVYTAKILENKSQETTYVKAITAGSTTAVSVLVSDQWAQPIGSGYDARLLLDTAGDRSTDPTTAVEKTVSVSNGSASISVVDNGVGTTTTTNDKYEIEIAKKLSNGNYDSNVLGSDLFFELKTVASVAVSSIGITGLVADATTGKFSVTGKDLTTTGTFANYDSVSNASGTVPSLGSNGYAFTIETGVAGQTVTVTAADAAFRVAGKDVYGSGSITTNAQADGTLDLVMYSQKSGTRTVSIGAGAKSVVFTVGFDAAAEDSGTSVVIKAVNTIKAGRTLVLTGQVLDQYGNGVDTNQDTNDARADTNLTFSVSYDGPGLIVGDLPTKTDADGKFSVRVLLGSADSGLATLAVSYDIDGATTTNAAVEKSSATLIAVSASVSAGSKKANVVVKGAEGLTVKVVSGTKVATKTATSDSYKLSLSKLTSGSKTVKVYVNDILVTSKKVTVRR